MILAFGLAGWATLAGATVLLWGAVTYNRLVQRGNRVREAYSGVDVQLKRRHDLVPNLVRVVKAYATHERETLDQVIEARDAAQAADALPEREAGETGLGRSLTRLFALVERYPELKADKNFRKLHADLVEIEDHLQYARRYYNGTVRDLNNVVESFPSNLVAGLVGRKSKPFFELDEAAERAAPRIDFQGEEEA
jgi:LemA protein